MTSRGRKFSTKDSRSSKMEGKRWNRERGRETEKCERMGGKKRREKKKRRKKR